MAGKIKRTVHATESADPRVRSILDELTALCKRHEDATGALLTALLMTCVSAVKSFGVHPREFVANFDEVYANTRPPIIDPTAPGEEVS